MGIFNGLAAVEEEIIKCMKCGNCQAVCPIYKETRREPSVARGKIKLAAALLQGEVRATPALAERFDLCLTCLACQAACPSGVQVGRIILAARAAVAAEKGLPLAKKTVFSVVRRPRLFHLGARAGARLQGLLFKRIAPDKMRPRFPLGLEMRRIIPPLAPVTFRQQVAANHPVERCRATVALFTGCLLNYVYPEIGRAALHVLQGNGAAVVIPPEQHCCGAPLLYNGAAEMVRDMARSHVDLFSRVQAEAIITMCGTCGETFKHHYPDLLAGDPAYAPKAREVAARVVDIAQFLYRLPLEKNALKPLDLTVTYHQPCHLGRGLGVVQEPLALIRSIPGIRFVPLKAPDRCCGNAGSFSLTHYPLSCQILTHKIKDIAGTGARAVITGCPACRMQLTDGLGQAKMPLQVMHTIELLARAMPQWALSAGR
ncbi:MAG: (Fe-S)-binding protein [Thermoanaerobacteraceae bacterium]|nr:(Fe-S)-binding protein [Thermoanaerobacteraceae bacterium]